MKVGLFVTCLVDGLMPQVGKATAALLRRLGVQVDVPLPQTCCGQMHINTGWPREALPLVRNYVRVFEGYDAVVAPSGSRTASVRHQHAGLAHAAGDDSLAEAAGAVAASTLSFPSSLSTSSAPRTSAPTSRIGLPITRPVIRCGCCG